MYKIKDKPEDFIVKEITNVKLGNGDYSVFLLNKKDYTTIKAIQKIAERLNIKLKRIGFAGTKDKKAVTEQYISIFKTNIKDLILKDIKLKYIGKSEKPISLGDLEGNEFRIIIRDINKRDINNFENNLNKIEIPNYFGEQRFSKNNKEIGENIVKDDYKKSISFIIKDDKEYGDKIKDYLKKNKNNYIGALRLIPIKILRLYVHSYQSYLWNLAAKECLKSNADKKKIPVIGFGTEIKDMNIKKMIDKIMEKEKINFRDF